MNGLQEQRLDIQMTILDEIISCESISTSGEVFHLVRSMQDEWIGHKIKIVNLVELYFALKKRVEETNRKKKTRKQ